jgi:hypothetical protein
VGAFTSGELETENDGVGMKFKLWVSRRERKNARSMFTSHDKSEYCILITTEVHASQGDGNNGIYEILTGRAETERNSVTPLVAHCSKMRFESRDWPRDNKPVVLRVGSKAENILLKALVWHRRVA